MELQSVAVSFPNLWASSVMAFRSSKAKAGNKGKDVRVLPPVALIFI
jgi:hypothetical protein